MLGCAAEHPLASADVVRAEDLVEFPYIDRLRCEFRDQIQEHFARREIVMRPRFRTEREDWVQRVVADGHAICILPERSAAVPGPVTPPVEGLSFVRSRNSVVLGKCLSVCLYFCGRSIFIKKT